MSSKHLKILSSLVGMDRIPSALIKFGIFTFMRRLDNECNGSDNNYSKGKVGVLMLHIGFPGKVLK